MTKFAVSLSLILVMACSASGQGGPPRKPGKALDAKDPQSLADHLIFNSRSQKTYSTTFTAQLAPPQGDAIDYKGQCLWIRPGVLYIHYAASGGDEKNIIRAGNRVWVHHPFAGWTPAAEMGLNGAARGIQNPDEVLSVLAGHLEDATFVSPGVIGLRFVGKKIADIMREQAQQGAFDWKESGANIQLHSGADNRLKAFVCDASLKPTDPAVKGTVKYAAKFEVVDYNKTATFTFRDEDKNEIELSAQIKKAIETVRKEQP